MERLTARSAKNGLAYLVKVKSDEQEIDSKYPNTLRCILEAFNRLAELEEADVQVENLKADLELWRNRALSADTAGHYHTHDATERMILTGWCDAVCGTCGKELGWWCEDSPTHTCDYWQDDGSYDEDQCRYCGEPEERK